MDTINRYYQSINEEEQTNNINIQLNTNVNTSSRFAKSLFKKFNSKVYTF